MEQSDTVDPPFHEPFGLVALHNWRQTFNHIYIFDLNLLDYTMCSTLYVITPLLINKIRCYTVQPFHTN